MDFVGVSLDRNCPVPMTDGTLLRADVYRPSAPGRFPVLLLRTPYDKTTAQSGVYEHPSWYARQGYVVVVQDTRGRFASSGSFEPYRWESEDGADTIEWAAQLKGANGKVGTYGFSYSGASQLLAAQKRPSGLVCAAIGCAGADFFDGWTYRGGALQLAFVLSWTLGALAIPDALKRGDRRNAETLLSLASDMHAAYGRPLADWLRSGELPAFFEKWVTGDTRNDYWKSLSSLPGLPDIHIPCLHLGGWYDIFLGGTLDAYRRLTEQAGSDPRRAQFLAVGPWQHVPWSRLNGAADFGAAGDNRADELQLSWFDHWLKDRPFGEDVGKVRYFLMGANEWQTDSSWPPADARACELYFHSSGTAARRLDDGMLTAEPPRSEPPDIYVYDPGEPVPSIGGASCCRPDLAPVGVFDQRRVESRTDVLTYTSGSFAEDCDVVGPVDVVLHAATDAVDTDWTAKLVDVHPNGSAMNICDGIVRARYRESLEQPRLIEPGQVYEFRISLASTAMRILAGHRLRLEISSSNFPNYDVNSNTGVSAHRSAKLDAVVATQIVYHDSERPSRLRLLVRGALPAVGHDRSQ